MAADSYQFSTPPTGNLSDSEQPGVTAWSVSELNRNIRRRLETDFGLVWVRAEISNFKHHTSGHCYFALKDSSAQIKAVMFKGFNSKLRFRPTDGMEVLVRGRITVYEPRGDYQINCELMEPVGAGALQKAFEQLKLKLQQEGLTDPKRKRPLPVIPRHVAIVTSPTGAAIRDMINILSRRFPLVQITVVPTVVQGEAAAPKIRQALALAQRLPFVDVIVVGRGGGSIEDMWCFNDEALAREIAASPIPVVSAVGHEIDFTIADFVADVRAPTPSAAAELIVPDRQDLLRRLVQLNRLLFQGWNKNQVGLRRRLEVGTHRLTDPRRRLQDLILRADELLDRLVTAQTNSLRRRFERVEYLRKRMRSPADVLRRKREQVARLMDALRMRAHGRLDRWQARFAEHVAVLESLSPLKTVARGYTITRDAAGRVLGHDTVLRPGDLLRTQWRGGEIESRIENLKLAKENPWSSNKD